MHGNARVNEHLRTIIIVQESTISQKLCIKFFIFIIITIVIAGFLYIFLSLLAVR